MAGQLKQAEVQSLRIIRMLGDFQLHGSILRRYYKHKDILHNPCFIQVIGDFKRYRSSVDYSKVTSEHYTKISSRFMDYVDSLHIDQCSGIDITTINGYIKTLAGYTYKTVEQQLCALRSFFKFLFLNNLISNDYSGRIPMIQTRKQTRIPSVWPIDELNRLISAIDRGSPMGKRDYAMILLASRLGLRVGDIKQLTFENFLWDSNQLVFTQSKTKTIINLPLLQDVGWAVIDYIRYGRPTIDSKIIFVRHLAPFLPFSQDDHLSQIVLKYLRLAHLPVSPQRKVGMHSLRHTLASRLLEKETPLPVISDILGHLSTESTAVYLKVDIEKLRECSLQINIEKGSGHE